MRSTKLPSWSSRLLGLAPRPAPPHVFRVGRERLEYGCFARADGGMGLTEYHSVALPAGAFGEGPLGGAPRDTNLLRQAVAALLERISSPVRQASLVLPDAWLRSAFVEVGELPRQAAARLDVLRWKLKRQVPFRVEDLRLASAEVSALPGQEEPHRLLLGFASEATIAALEQAFAAHGVHLGLVACGSLCLLAALADRAPDALLALALVEADGYSLVFAYRGEPVLHRFKPFQAELPDAARGELLVRELFLTRTFLAERLPGQALGRAVVAAPADVEPFWIEVLSRGLERRVEPLAAAHLPLGGDATTPGRWVEIAPMLGASCQEVA